MAAVLDTFHPLVRQWFAETLGAPSPPQAEGWPAIASGEHALILAPTGTGKTLAAFLYELNALIVEGQRAALPNAVQILYVSPLKALGNDIHRNLERPLAELRRRFETAGEPFPAIRIAVRTGDTSPSARARMLRITPHVLITTPESLNILLTTVRGRTIFPGVRAVIVDEIHAVAGTKRGAHLALTLERLDAACRAAGRDAPQRIGLSATQRPLEEIARFLGGCESSAGNDADTPPRFRRVRIVDCGLVKPMELAVRSPVPDLAHVQESVWPAVAALAVQAMQGSRTTLVFVNNRAQAEKMAARLNEVAGSPIARPYHGSLSRDRRLELERALKAGELPALVTTSSLELGIDIGSVDLVLQLQSPKRVATGLQRVGRAGHTVRDVSRGILVPTYRDDLVECAAVARAMLAGEVEATRVSQNALDVLAQSIVAMASVEETTADALYALVRRAYPYHRLTRAAYEETLAMLAGKYPSDLAAELEARLSWDRVSGRIVGSRGSRMTAIISGGTIPDRGLYTVNLPDRTRLGELDEEFVHESRVGDVFQLGSATWRIGAIEHDRVIVTPAPGRPARMPFWHGEFMTRSVDLSRRVGQLRRELGSDTVSDEMLEDVYRCDAGAVHTLRGYVAAQRVATGVIPDDRTLVIEHFRDETGGIRVVFHSIFGGRVNAPWGMALGHRMRELLGGTVDLQVETSDDGIMLRMPDLGRLPPVHALLELTPAEVERRVIDEVGGTALFGARFRMNAGRALLLPRGSPRRRMPLWLQRLKALDLLEVVRQFPSFPVLVETYREVLQDAFDLPAVSEVVQSLVDRRMAVHVVESERPSPFATGLQFGFVMDWLYADDTPRAERAAARLSLDREMLTEVMGEALEADEGTERALDEILARRRGTARARQGRNADELAVLLERAGDLSPEEMRERTAPPDAWLGGADPAEALRASGRAAEWPMPSTDRPERLVPAELHAWYEDARAGNRRARRDVLARHLVTAGPVTVAALHARYGWPTAWIETQLSDWQRVGRVIRGRFRRGVDADQWCARGVVAAARRLALRRLRREIEPVDLATFQGFLTRWQHLDPRDRLSGEGGVAAVIQQLAGLARPATGWERDYLPARVERYEASWLSRLTSGGSIVWAAASAPRPRDVGGATAGRDQRPEVGESRRPAAGGAAIATVRFFARGAGGVWLAPDEAPPLTEAAARVRDVLVRQGASFLADLQTATGLGPLATREAVRELVAAGLATNDTVEALRAVIHVRALPLTREEPDPTRWLPASFTPSPTRIVQRRINVTRLPRWRRPDGPGAMGQEGWIGRWSLIRPQGAPLAAPPEEAHAAEIARCWLARYGIVARDWWRRERPPVSWRAIYHELKRLEYRGEVRRGYFVEGLSGAQFALPDAVEQLRAARADQDAPLVIFAASDPANVYGLPPSPIAPTPVRDPLTRPRGSGAVLVTRRGTVLLAVEGRGRRLRIAPRIEDEQLLAALTSLHAYLSRGQDQRHRRLPALDTIDGLAAASSPRIAVFRQAGFRLGGLGLDWPTAQSAS